MTLPAGTREAIEERVGPVDSLRAVTGGSIHAAWRVEARGGPAFLKYGAAVPGVVFRREASGLEALRRSAPSLRIPEVLGWGGGEAGGWLLLEWLEPGPGGPDFERRLAAGLVELHEARDGSWGWEEDNFLGPLPQPNAPLESWAEFWWERRLSPLAQRLRASSRLPGTEREWLRLRDGLPELLSPANDEGPSLLHGDLWSGNALALAGGAPALVDPAVYRGHREVDLAMTQLFGGFSATLVDTYGSCRPLAPGYPVRRAVYQLYYLMVHVELFGSGYALRTRSALHEALSAL